jgi:alcohol dehydrogenase class IV
MTTDAALLKGNWNYPTSVKFGVGRIKELPEHCKALGLKRPLLITDPGLAGLPMIKDAIARNEAAGIPTGLFSSRTGSRSIRPASMTASSPSAADRRWMRPRPWR